MKVYGIFPAIELVEIGRAGSRVQDCIAAVAKLVTDCLRDGGDVFHYAVDWRDPGSDPNDYTWHEDVAEPHIVRLHTAEGLLARVKRSVDPFDPTGTTIRSIATCRAATFGYDGQAFVCLRHEDAPPASSDPLLLTVEERPDVLVDFDLFDGWVRAVNFTQEA